MRWIHFNSLNVRCVSSPMKSPQEKSSTLTLKQKQVNGAILRTTVSSVPLIFFRLQSFVSTIQKSQFVYLSQNIIFVLPEAEERFVNCEADQGLWPLTKCLDVSLDRALGR